MGETILGSKELAAISTFSGAGGLDIGFERVEGISIKALIEKDPHEHLVRPYSPSSEEGQNPEQKVCTNRD